MMPLVLSTCRTSCECCKGCRNPSCRQNVRSENFFMSLLSEIYIRPPSTGAALKSLLQVNVARGSAGNWVFCTDVVILCTRVAKTNGQGSNGPDQTDLLRMYGLKSLPGDMVPCYCCVLSFFLLQGLGCCICWINVW